jgi:glutamyl-tRNA reductase
LFAELERSLSGRLKHLTEGDRTALAQMLESAANKLLHAPTTKLRSSAVDGDGAGELAAAVRVLFDLPEVTAAKPELGPEGSEAGTAAGDDDGHTTH